MVDSFPTTVEARMDGYIGRRDDRFGYDDPGPFVDLAPKRVYDKLDRR